MGVVIHIEGGAGGGGTGTGWNGTVEFRADLPITIGSPAIGEVYLVQKPTTILFGAYTSYQSGLYIRDFDTGALSDWRKLNVKVKFTDSEFAIVSAGDESKQSKFDLSLITTGTTRTLQPPNKNGIIATLSDIAGATQDLSEVLTVGNITGGTDILTSNNDRIRPVNGTSQLDLRQGGVDDNFLLSNDQSYISATAFGMVMQDGSFFSGVTVPTFTLSNGNQSSISLIKQDFTKSGTIAVYDNESIDRISTNAPTYPVALSTQNSTIKQNLVNGGILFGKDIIAKTNNTAYLNQIGFNKGEAFELIIDNTIATADRLQTLQDDDGVIALTKNIAISQAYTIQTILNAPILTVDQDNYSPVGFDENTDLIRVDVDFNNRAITGIPAPPLGVFRILGIKNINTASLDLRFEHNNAGSLAPNRFLCRDNNNKSIKPNEIALWFYDHNVLRWTPYNRIG